MYYTVEKIVNLPDELRNASLEVIDKRSDLWTRVATFDELDMMEANAKSLAIRDEESWPLVRVRRHGERERKWIDGAEKLVTKPPITENIMQRIGKKPSEERRDRSRRRRKD